MAVLMTCGCATTAKLTNTGQPYCLVHDVTEIAHTTPSLRGRTAVCHVCGRTTASSFDLFLFHHFSHIERDSYYCGCQGWN